MFSWSDLSENTVAVSIEVSSFARYVHFNQEDELILKEIIEEQRLMVLFLGVVNMEGNHMNGRLAKRYFSSDSSTDMVALATHWS
jgi:predicted transcriptional regulator